MPTKDVHLFDASNQPLTVSGIRLELFDALTCQLLAVQNSAQLSSNAWGAQLSFTAGSNPLDIYVSDPNYRYPGNTVRYLNGRTTDQLDIDLLTLPPGPGGQPAPSLNSTPASLARWVDEAYKWNSQEKEAVRNLIFNYLSVFASRQTKVENSSELKETASNWRTALERVGISYQILERRAEGQVGFAMR